MAGRFVIGLAIIALCHSSPVHEDGPEENRSQRSLSLAKGIASGFGGANSASAKLYGNVVEATGSNSGANLGQGQVITDAQYYDNAEQAAVDIARAQGYYHPYPVAQPAVITYNQNIVPAEQLVYQPLPVAPSSAVSSAVADGNSESSQSSATNFGSDGVAESNSETLGNYGKTSTVAKTVGNHNTAASNANTRLGAASVSSKATSSGAGTGLASSNAQTNGFLAPAAPIVPEVIPSVIAAKYQGFYNPALYGSASSNANTVGHGSADSSARVGPTRRSISWRFGTAYDIPAGYGAIKTVPTVYQPAPVVYQPAPVVYRTVPVGVSPDGTAQSSANTQGSGNAQSNAQVNPGYGSTRSTANSNLDGKAQANANINNNAYGLYRSGAFGSGVAKTSANTNGLGFADSNADWNHGVGVAKSVANSNGGFSNANADINNYGSGLYRSTGEVAPWSRTISDAKSTGFGSAVSSARGDQFGHKVADSSVKSTGWGSSIAHSQSL